MHHLLPTLALTLLATGGPETVRYLRPAGKDFATERTFTLQGTALGHRIESVTERGKTKMIVSANYDTDERLLLAKTKLHTGDDVKSAAVRVTKGKATVERDGLPAQEFDVPAGVIVTSAPDWTDTFLLCKRYDRKKGGKQSFPGLWIHPTMPSQRVDFHIERMGADTIVHKDKKVALDRFTIWLRGNSSYAAWADGAGRMIKLVPLPAKEGATNWLVLEGYEKAVGELRP